MNFRVESLQQISRRRSLVGSVLVVNPGFVSQVRHQNQKI